VVNLIPALPSSKRLEVRSTFGGEGTYDNSLLAATHSGQRNLLAAGGLIGTDGYIQESPSQRGPVDVASNVHSQNALVLAGRDFANLKFFVRGTGFDEFRHNGTPYQINATRLIRYSTGVDWQNAHSTAVALRFYGSDERYRQTFSSISNPNTLRNGETPSKFSYVPDNELGASAHWSQPIGAGLLFVAGADAHDVRVWDREQSYTGTDALTNLADHQRDSAAYIEAMWTHKAWTLVASSRMDWFQNYDGHETQWNGSTWTPTAAQPPQRDERIFDPRLGVSYKLSDHWALTASGFRAFRSPTPSELYRSTQVGNQLTLPNGNLLSERATGWEAGLAAQRSWGSIRSSYFLTEVNRPIVALTINPTSSPILLMRENLGQIESRGISLDYELHPRSWLAVDGGYQYAHAVVSRGTQDLGNWIPEVARNMATLNLRASRPRLGTISLESRLSGRQFDDDANAYLLHGYFRLDAYASHNFTRSPFGKHLFGSQIEIFAAGENLFNRSIEVSKTPTTTLGQPRTARAGFLIHLGHDSK
jgi:outer membrane receptor protein involved in Fe transport